MKTSVVLAIVTIVVAVGAVGIVSAVGAPSVAHAGLFGSCNQENNGEGHLVGSTGKENTADRKANCESLKHNNQ